MFRAQPLVIADPSWEVPAAELTVLSGKRHRYALVIPVINEGERIRRQLKAIAEFAPDLDVVIADGGSTDGSVEPDYLATFGVRALLVKRGPGRLSAQLRMAYAWALEEGYEGIVTMDGNAKDGVEGLPRFIAALDAGGDYVQGSRYHKDGAAINTPLDRKIAGRLIHAPLLSLAAGRWFTDTTNGFRAYSRRYLTDPRVAPFRDVFGRYNLLFYLTIRANQLGYGSQEVPVRRSYLAGEKPPTKITGLRSRLAVLGETLDAATGAFSPDDPASPMGRRDWRDTLVVGLFIAMVAALFLGFLTTPRYNTDSWAYYELSKTVFDDFYRTSHIRTYSSESEYGSSFPPLWPALIAVFDGVFQTGARSGYGLAFLAFLAFAFMAELAGRTAFRTRWIGLGVTLLILIDHRILPSEILGGRTMPLQMVFFATVLYVLLGKRDLAIGRSAALGALAGLAAMNRFDALLFPGLMCVGILFLSRRLSAAFAFGIGATVMMLPWVYYSITTFGSPFVTDNSAVALALDANAFVTDWWPVSQPTAFENPGGWIDKVIGNLTPLILKIIRSWTVVALLCLGVLGGAFVFVTSQGRTVPFHDSARRIFLVDGLALHEKRVSALLFLVFSAMMSTYVVTGYMDVRYFAPLLWISSLIGVGSLVQWGRSVAQRRNLSLFCFGVLATLTLAVWGVSVVFSPPGSGGSGSSARGDFDRPEIISTLDACLSGAPRDTRILVVGDGRLAARLGALAGRRAMIEPRNMEQGRLDGAGARAFIEHWRVNHVLVAKPERVEFVRTTLPVSPVPDCELELYKVTGG